MLANDFERHLVVVNRKSAHFERASDVIAQIEELPGKDLEIFYTQNPADGGVPNKELIASKIKPGTLVYGLGGDGSDNTIYEACGLLAKDNIDNLKEVALLSLPLGDGNDLANSIFGKGILLRQSIAEILNQGQTRWADAIKLEDEVNGIRFAHSYVGIGYTGLVAAYMNKRLFRNARRLKPINFLPGKVVDAPAAALAAFNRELFEYLTMDGNEHTAQEIIFAIMPLMAGGAIKFNKEPFDHRMLTIEFGAKRFVWEVAKRMFKEGLRQGFNGDVVESSIFTALSTTTMHRDGEPQMLEEGVTIKVSRVSDMVQLITLPKHN